MASEPVTSQPEGGQAHPVDILTSNDYKEWKHTLCGCLDDPVICIKGLVCIPCAWACIAMKMKENICLPILTLLSSNAAFRTRFRTVFNLKGSVAEDWLATHFCLPCATMQMLREMNDMGL